MGPFSKSFLSLMLQMLLFCCYIWRRLEFDLKRWVTGKSCVCADLTHINTMIKTPGRTKHVLMNSPSVAWWFACVGSLCSSIINLTERCHGHTRRRTRRNQSSWSFSLQITSVREQISASHRGGEPRRSTSRLGVLVYESLTPCHHWPPHAVGRPRRQMTAQTGSVRSGYTEQTLAATWRLDMVYICFSHQLTSFPPRPLRATARRFARLTSQIQNQVSLRYQAR